MRETAREETLFQVWRSGSHSEGLFHATSGSAVDSTVKLLGQSSGSHLSATGQYSSRNNNNNNNHNRGASSHRVNNELNSKPEGVESGEGSSGGSGDEQVYQMSNIETVLNIKDEADEARSRLLIFQLRIRGVMARVMIDSGASTEFISKEWIDRNSMNNQLIEGNFGWAKEAFGQRTQLTHRLQMADTTLFGEDSNGNYTKMQVVLD